MIPFRRSSKTVHLPNDEDAILKAIEDKESHGWVVAKMVSSGWEFGVAGETAFPTGWYITFEKDMK